MANKITLELDVNSSQAVKGFKDLEKAGTHISKSLSANAKQVSAAWSTLKGVVGANLITGAFSKFASAASGAFSVIAENTILIETLTTEMTTMTGSAEKAAEVMAKLTNFAATTPFQLEGIANAAKKLIAFGFEADSITDKLQRIGDVAAGSGADLGEVALIFGQVKAASKLTGERLLQFQERAIPIGPALAKTMGIAETAVKDMVSRGKVDFATFETAFNSLSDQGGIFFNSMVDKSDTLAGVISTLKDNFNLFAGDLGKKFLPIFKAIAKATISFIQDNKKNLTENLTSGLLNGIKKLLKVLPDLAMWFDKAFVVTINAAKITMSAFVIVADAVGFAMATIAKVAIGIQIAYLKMKGLITDTTKETEDAIQSFKDMTVVQEEFLSSIGSGATDVVTSVKEIGTAITSTGGNSALGTLIANVNTNLTALEEGIKKTTAAASQTVAGGGGFFAGIFETVKASAESFIAGFSDNAAVKSIGNAGAKLGQAFGQTLSSGAAAQRAGMDEIANIERQMQEAKKAGIAEESEEYRKLVNDKIKAEEKLGNAQKKEATSLVAKSAGAVLGTINEGLGSMVEGLINLASDPDAIVGFIQSLIDAIPQVIDGIVAALPRVIRAIVDALPTIIEAIIDALPDIFEAIAENIPAIALALVNGIGKLILRLPAILYAVIRGLFNGIGKDVIPKWIAQFKNQFESVVKALKAIYVEFPKKIFEASKQFTIKILEAGKTFFTKILEGAKQFITKIIEEIKGALGIKGGSTTDKAKNVLDPGGVLRKGAKALGFASGGVIPRGFPNDTFPALLSSGEVVLNKDQQKAMSFDSNTTQALLGQILAATKSPIQVSAQLNLNNNAFADIILQLNKDNRRLA